MRERVKNLFLMQLFSRRGLKQKITRNQKLVRIAVRSFAFVFLVIIFYLLIFFFQSFSLISINKNKLLFILFVYNLLSVLFCLNDLTKSLYQIHDEFSLSFPVKPEEVFIAKIFLQYYYEFFKNIFFLAPLFLGYGLVKGFLSLGYLSVLLIILVILPLLTVLISALVSIPYYYLRYLIREYPLIKYLFFTGIVVAIFAFLNLWINKIPESIKIFDFWYDVLVAFDGFAMQVNRFAFYSSWIIDAFFKIALFKNLGSLLMLAIVLVVLNYFVARPLYFKIINNLKESQSGKKFKHKPKPLKLNKKGQVDYYSLFLDKEMKLFFRDEKQMKSTYTYVLLFPLLLFCLNVIYSSFKINYLGQLIIYVINIFLGLVLLLSSNISSAMALSGEGEEFYLLKIAPINVKNILWAKITVNFLVSTIIILITIVSLSFVAFINVRELAYIALIYYFVNTGHIFWSFELDLMNPRIKEAIEGETIDDNKNATKSIFIGVILAFIFAFLAYFFISKESYEGWYKVIAIAIMFFLARLYLLINRLNVYFKEIEY
ncbi:MAG: putative ABC transporter permease subunit [Bacilli bacterium]